MRSVVKQTLKYGAIALGILLLIPGSYLGYLYFTYIDQTIASGSAYGFSVGQSKTEAYRIAQEKFRAKEIVGINTLRNREEEHQSHPWLREEFLGVDEVQERFDQWDHWDVWLRGREPKLLTLITWRGSTVSRVGRPGALGQRWQPEAGATLEIAAGDTYEEVYGTLQALAQAPGYEDLAVRTGWMARRQPIDFLQEEYRFVEPYDEWTLFVDDEWRYFDTIRLSFDDGTLANIHRHRQYFELP